MNASCDKKTIKDRIKELSFILSERKKELIMIFFISCFIAFLFFQPIYLLAKSLMPTVSVVISNSNEDNKPFPIWIVDNKDEGNLFSSFVNGGQTGEWVFLPSEQTGYSMDVFVSSGKETESLCANMKWIPSSYIYFWGNATSGTITIDCHNIHQEINLYTETEGGEYFTYFPAANSKRLFIIQAIIYVIVILVLFSILTYIYIHFKRQKKNNIIDLIEKTAPRWLVFPFTIIIFGLSIAQYKIGIPNFMQFGDQLYYWRINLFSSDVMEIVSFRGYICHLFPSISRLLGSLLNVDPFYFFFFFLAFLFSCFVCIILPSIYSLLQNKNAKIKHIICFTAIYMYFWLGTLTTSLVDLPGTIAFFSGILAIIKAVKEKNIGYSLLAGFCFSAACNYRLAYQYGVFAILILGLIWMVCRKKIKIGIKRLLLISILFLLGFLIVAIPQIIINLKDGTFSLLPYDYNEAWMNTSLTESSINYSLSSSYSGYPLPVSDQQLVTMESALYPKGGYLSLFQALGVYLYSPLESAIYLLKKLIIAFDVQTSASYPMAIDWRETHGLVFSALNYCVLLSGVYTFLYSQRIGKGEKIIAFSFGLGLILPQMILHIEWRYFLSSFVLLYFFFSFYFIDEILERKNKVIFGRRYAIYMLISIFLLFTFSLSINP